MFWATSFPPPRKWCGNTFCRQNSLERSFTFAPHKQDISVLIIFFWSRFLMRIPPRMSTFSWLSYFSYIWGHTSTFRIIPGTPDVNLTQFQTVHMIPSGRQTAFYHSVCVRSFAACCSVYGFIGVFCLFVFHLWTFYHWPMSRCLQWPVPSTAVSTRWLTLHLPQHSTMSWSYHVELTCLLVLWPCRSHLRHPSWSAYYHSQHKVVCQQYPCHRYDYTVHTVCPPFDKSNYQWFNEDSLGDWIITNQAQDVQVEVWISDSLHTQSIKYPSQSAKNQHLRLSWL